MTKVVDHYSYFLVFFFFIKKVIKYVGVHDLFLEVGKKWGN